MIYPYAQFRRYSYVQKRLGKKRKDLNCFDYSTIALKETKTNIEVENTNSKNNK